MERQEFLKTLGISFAAVCVDSCLSACGKDGDNSPNNGTPPPPTGTTVSANLSDLSTIGAKVIVSGVAFFRISAGDTATSFIATEPLCTHQSGNLNWIQNASIIRCDRHNAQFNSNGVNISPPQGGGSASDLKTFLVTVTGTTVNATV